MFSWIGAVILKINQRMPFKNVFIRVYCKFTNMLDSNITLIDLKHIDEANRKNKIK